MNTNDVITGETWLSMLTEAKTPTSLVPSSIEWVACKGSTENYRGYPCGLWTLFHTLTANAVLVHSEHKNGKYEGDFKSDLNMGLL